jgi:ribosome-binding protein aMBF1 (putative translation factor)
MVVVIAPNIRIRKEVVEEEEEEEEKPNIHTASRKIEDLLDVSYKSPTYFHTISTSN